MSRNSIFNGLALTLGIVFSAVVLGTNAEGAVHIGGSAWIWENPTPQGNSLNAVSCPSLNVCFAVGDLGTILTTTNAHTINPTFSGQPSPTTQTLRGISCASTMICVAVGDNGTILTTSTGGASWNLDPISFLGSPITANLNAISCPSTTTCFVAGNLNMILTTTNNFVGNSWSGISFGQSGDSLSGISCPSTGECFAVGPLIGGSTGQVLKYFYSFNCSCFTTATISTPEVFPDSLAAISCASTSDCVAVDFQGNAVFTTDGGSGWSLRKVDSKASLYAVSCVSGTGNCTAVGALGPSNDIFVSIDGGNTWLAVTSNQPFDVPLNGVSCQNFGSGACVAVGFDGAIIGNPSSGYPHSIESYFTTNNPVNLSRASCPSVGECFAVGGGQILATNNGGSTWTVQISMTNNSLSGISCPSISTCFAAGNPVLFTNNGGGTWNSKPTGFTTSLAAISCPTTTTCFAAGSAILETTNGGLSWTNPFTPGFFLLGISCASANACVAVGVQGEIVTFNGLTWSTQFLPSHVLLHDVSCFTTSNCVAVGNGSTILSTTNGGTSWSAQTVPAGHDFSSVSCLASVSLCEATTFQGEVFGGPGTWTLEAAIDPIYALEGVSCVGALLDYRCVAVGTTGTIISKLFEFTIFKLGELTPGQ
jgi:photosystem II stability/assembly factor-like uncharacterized protein